jgi:hypothetical protein
VEINRTASLCVEGDAFQLLVVEVIDESMDFTLEQGKAVLRRTPLALQAMLFDLPECWTACDEGPDTWSPYMVVGHMLHLEESDWIDRTRLVLGNGGGVFEPIDREGGFDRYRGWQLGDLVERFTVTRTANLAELDALPRMVDVGRTAIHPDFGQVTLGELLATWVVHDLNHLDQIVKTMAKQYSSAVGPWRAYLPIIDAV